MHAIFDPALHPEGQAIAGCVDGIDHAVEIFCLKARYMQDRAEDFACQVFDAVDCDDGRGDEIALWRAVNFNWPIKGYYYWTLVDNFEWERGWTQRFG